MAVSLITTMTTAVMPCPPQHSKENIAEREKKGRPTGFSSALPVGYVRQEFKNAQSCDRRLRAAPAGERCQHSGHGAGALFGQAPGAGGSEAGGDRAAGDGRERDQNPREQRRAVSLFRAPSGRVSPQRIQNRVCRTALR